jgi:hypothetical protein
VEPRSRKWRAALRVFEHAYGRAPERVDDGFTLPDDPEGVRGLSWRQMEFLAASVLGELATDAPTIVAAASGTTTGTALAAASE